jgi:hypothetical protein
MLEPEELVACALCRAAFEDLTWNGSVRISVTACPERVEDRIDLIGLRCWRFVAKRHGLMLRIASGACPLRVLSNFLPKGMP